MIFWAILLLELLVLFVTSRRISASLFLFSHKIFKSEKIAVIPVFVLLLPGVVIHELAHLLIAEILFVKTYGIEIFPKIENGHLHMGSVQIRQTDMVRRFLIGVAPLIVGSLILFGILFYILNGMKISEVFSSPLNVLKSILIIWVLFFTTNTMFSSKKDMEGAFKFIIIFLFLALISVIAAYILKINLIAGIYEVLTASGVVDALKIITSLFMVPVVINLLVAGGLRSRFS